MTEETTELAMLLDREAIKELTARYARLVAHGDGRAVGALFTLDGQFKAGVAHIVGRADIQDFLERAATPGKNLPLVVNHIIEIAGADATCFCMMYTPWFRHEMPGFCGEYHDTLRKEDGQWRFVERSFHFHKGRPAGA